MPRPRRVESTENTLGGYLFRVLHSKKQGAMTSELANNRAARLTLLRGPEITNDIIHQSSLDPSSRIPEFKSCTIYIYLLFLTNSSETSVSVPIVLESMIVDIIGLEATRKQIINTAPGG